MKKTFGLWLLSVILTACGGKEEAANIKSTITGTYVRQAEGEYSKAMDTLIVTPYNVKAGTFIVMRRTGFHRIKDGRFQPKESKKKFMITVWNEETHQLQELKEGKLYTFPADGKEVLAGAAKYRKIE